MKKKPFILIILMAALFFTAFEYSELNPPPLEMPPVSAKLVALTFDDGPHCKYTPMILDVLAKYNAKATFFVLGDRVADSEDILKRMLDEGHDIGNHTYSHKEITKLNEQGLQNEIEKASNMIEEVTGYNPILIRPPGGFHSKRTDEAIEKLGKAIILWSVDPRDWKHQDAERVYKQVVNKVRHGDIILLHDFYESTVDAVDMLLDTLTKEGYVFVKVTDLLRQNADLVPGQIYHNGR